MGPSLHTVPLRALLWHAVPSGGGGRPLGSGGAEGRACGSPAGGGAGGWGGGVAPPPALGPDWEGGGEWGGPSGPLTTPPDGQGGGRHGGPGPGGQPSAGRSRPSPAPLYLEPDPRAGPRWGPSSPQAVVARRWPTGGGREG